VNSDGWEIALPQELVQFSSTECALDEDDGLVELKLIKQFIELPVLLFFVKLDIVLLKAVECERSVIIDKNFMRILHELLANWSDFLGKSCAEHHHLLVCGCGPEDLLDVTSHVYKNVSMRDKINIQRFLPI
jgi:hypothetical protein